MLDLFDDPLDKMEEECGVFGMYNPNAIDTFSLMEFGMFALQHRGQEACGLTVLKNQRLNTFKHEGLVLDAFKAISDISVFQGNAAIGHTRYTTIGDSRTLNFQPLYALNYLGEPFLAIAHNGNLINDKGLRIDLDRAGINFMTTSDTEVILRLIQKHFSLGIEKAVKKTTKLIKGAYSILALTQNELIAFRDPNGIRPLCFGKLEDNTYVFSSETCGLDAVGAQYERDVKPGEMIIIDKKGIRYSNIHTNDVRKRICAFEYIYFARPDSRIEHVDVYDVRIKSGKKLYQRNPIEADVVIGIPDSGIPAAIGFSEASKIPFQPILVKNRYMSRSFIIPNQGMRERVVNLKFNPILSKIKNKKIVILDDSIVRGTTSKRLVKILRDIGAKKIHFRSACPPVVSPCFLGIDTPNKAELISSKMNKQELKDFLNVDSLDFLNMEDLIDILGGKEYCFGCFTGSYPVKPTILKQEQ